MGAASPGEQQNAPPGDSSAADLRGFGPIGVLTIVVILASNALFVPLGAILVLVWAWRSRTPWREIGYARPRSWLRSLAIGLAFGIAFKLAMKAIVMPLFGADPINQAFHFVTGNRAVLPAMLYAIIVGAGFGEETLFRSYAFERLGKLFGRHAWSMPVIVVLTAAWFGIEHYTLQGLPGVQQATVVGLVFGAIYARTREIWMLMFAHVAFDLTALALIYWDLETTVARWVFK